MVLDSIRTSHGVGVGIGFGIGNATGTSSLSDWSCSWFETLKLALFIARTLQVFSSWFEAFKLFPSMCWAPQRILTTARGLEVISVHVLGSSSYLDHGSRA